MNSQTEGSGESYRWLEAAAIEVIRVFNFEAVVVLRPEFRRSTDEEAIIAWARENMAVYEVPRLITFVDTLPRSGTGKILWRTLQD